MNNKKLLGGILLCILPLAACSNSSTTTEASSSTEAQSDSKSASATTADSASCEQASESDITALFDRWNDSLKTGDPAKVVENYASDSVLLPTVSNKVCTTAAEKEDYFKHFLEKKPKGTIDESFITIGCNTATDAGLYTFEYADGTKVEARYTYTYRWEDNDWVISSHHSSQMPEK